MFNSTVSVTRTLDVFTDEFLKAVELGRNAVSAGNQERDIEIAGLVRSSLSLPKHVNLREVDAKPISM
jgi:hypothetical protein